MNTSIPVKRTLRAKHGIMHIMVTPIEYGHIPVKQRYNAMTSFMNFGGAYCSTEDSEYIRGYAGGVNIADRKQHFEVWDTMRISHQ